MLSPDDCVHHWALQAATPCDGVAVQRCGVPLARQRCLARDQLQASPQQPEGLPRSVHPLSLSGSER